MQFFRHRRERGRPPHPDVLTPAEWRVLEQVRAGRTNAETAVRLGISVNTVRYHVSNMLAKTGTRDRTELAAWEGEPVAASRSALGRFGVAAPWAWLREGGWFGKSVAAAVVVAVSVAGAVTIASLNAVGGGDASRPSAPPVSTPDAVEEPPGTPVPDAAPAAVSGAFTGVAEPEQGRSFHAATLLDDGTVLVTGGCCDGSEIIAGAELYDPAADGWSSAGELVVPREAHTATKLPDGRVAIIGGVATGGTSSTLAAVELYDPDAGAFAAAGELNSARMAHAAVALPDGRLLVAGGMGLDDPPRDIEIFDPATSVAEVLDVALPQEFDEPQALLLDEDTVLLTGGGRAAMLGIAAAAFEELPAPDGLDAWPVHPVALEDGRILVAGGCCDEQDTLPHAALFDPLAGSSWAVDPMNNGRLGQEMTLLDDGRVLATGGAENLGSGFEDAATAELWDPTTETFVATASMATPRTIRSHTATLLNDGSVLVVGTPATVTGRAAERYMP